MFKRQVYSTKQEKGHLSMNLLIIFTGSWVGSISYRGMWVQWLVVEGTAG